MEVRPEWSLSYAVSFAHVQDQADVDFMAPTSLTDHKPKKAPPPHPTPPRGTEVCPENKKQRPMYNSGP